MVAVRVLIIVYVVIGAKARESKYSSIETALDWITPHAENNHSGETAKKATNTYSGELKLNPVNQSTEKHQHDLLHSENTTQDLSEVKPWSKVVKGANTLEKAGRETRSANDEKWIKLTFPNHEEATKNKQTYQSQDLLNSRMPRVNFVTQSKRLEPSESRLQRESVTKPEDERSDDEELRTDFVYPDNRARDDQSRENDEETLHQPTDDYYPEEKQLKYYDEPPPPPPGHRRYPVDELRRRDPYVMTNEPPLYPRIDLRTDRDERSHYHGQPRRTRRIIYYTTLPEVVKTGPSVDSRNRYRNYEQEYSPYRSGRYYEIYSKTRRYPHARDEYMEAARYPLAPYKPKEEPRLMERNPSERKLISEPPGREDSSSNESDMPPLRYENRQKSPKKLIYGYSDYRAVNTNRYDMPAPPYRA